MVSRFLGRLNDHRLNIGGRPISKKVVVFESDDWGTQRIPSKKAYEKLKYLGIDLDANPYNRFDSLETADDLSALFDVLSSFKDIYGNHPVITANYVLANPNFEAIAKDKFHNYYFEGFEASYERYNGNNGAVKILRSGIDAGIIKPQFHAREHVNVPQWLRMLRQKNQSLLSAFHENVFCIDVPNAGRRDNLMAALDYGNDDEKHFVCTHLTEGLTIFSKVFGFKSESFIAPCNVWDTVAEKVIADLGVKTIQSLRGQKMPILGREHYEVKNNAMGDRSLAGQVYLVRNAYFEPSTSSTYAWVDRCLEKIDAAFFWSKPAIVSTHRLNYIGSIFPQNRTANLSLLRQLISKILQRWPDVSFVASDDLRHLFGR